MATPLLLSGLGEVHEQNGAQAAALKVVRHCEGDLGTVAVRQLVAGVPDDAVRGAAGRDQAEAVLVIDVGCPLRGRLQICSEREEPEEERVLRQPTEEGEERLTVRWACRPHVHGAPVAQCDVGLAMRGIGRRHLAAA